jgi:hypothetical protein
MPVSTRGPKGEADGQGSQTVPSVNVPLAKELPAKLKVVSERPALRGSPTSNFALALNVRTTAAAIWSQDRREPV